MRSRCRCSLLRAAFVAAVFSNTAAYAQVFERTDAQKEIELGREAAAQVEAALPRSRDPVMRERVRRIGRVLTSSIPQRAYPYQFECLEVQDFNAFCLPGGFMYVFEGLLTKLPDDDAVAFVMAHEITHAAHRHWRRMVEKMRGPALLAAVAGAAFGSAEIAEFTATLVSAQYSREQERDADRSGVELMWAAGYDPSGAVDAARVMADLETGVETPTYLRSHPPAHDRLRDLTAQTADLAARQRTDSVERTEPLNERELVGVLPDVQLGPNRWFPLNVGSEWTYAISSGRSETRYSVRVRGKVPTSRGDIWRMETALPSAVPVTWQAFTTGGGVWRRDRPDSTSSRWKPEVSLLGSAGQAATGASVSSGQTVSTPCGVFTDVISLETESGGGVMKAWYASGVGLVKRVNDASGVTETLVSYRLVPEPAPPSAPKTSAR